MNQELRFSSEYEINIAVTANSPKPVSRSMAYRGAQPFFFVVKTGAAQWHMIKMIN